MKIAFVMTDGFDEREFRQPYDELQAAGVDVVVLGPVAHVAANGKLGRETVLIEGAVADADPSTYDGVVIPGGHSPDRLRVVPAVVAFVAAINRADGLVAAICHGPSLLIEASVVGGRQLTSWPSIRTDVINAGGRWVDGAVVQDRNLITSRKPDDVPQFCRAIVTALNASDGPCEPTPVAGVAQSPA